ncbi:hypothetical protein OIV83_000569 [Microbotryomycetes sp. JL201]|nr:hypothetical protein OIV83_000569 [Microbotryomycetes sp. JL201]
MYTYTPLAQSQDSLLPQVARLSPANGSAIGRGDGSDGQQRWPNKVAALLTGRQRTWKSKLTLVVLTAGVLYWLHTSMALKNKYNSVTDSKDISDPITDYQTVALEESAITTVATQTTATVSGTDEETIATGIPVVDASKYTQARREVPPTWPNPWPKLPKTWIGHKLLSPDRFPDGQGLRDPPERVFPPAKHMAKAVEFARWSVDAGDVLPNTRVGPHVQPAPAYDQITGRPLPVKHKDLYLKQSGWQSPDITALSDVRGKNLPRVQAESNDLASKADVREQEQRREWVKRAFLHAWEGYKQHAWGHDEIKPVSSGRANGYNGWGANIVDNLDTLLIMNLTHEYNLAREHVAELDFTFLVPSGSRTFSTDLPPLSNLDIPPSDATAEGAQDGKQAVKPIMRPEMDQHSPTTISWFETTIRYLGGMLSAYELSNDRLMLERAVELGDWLLPSLGTKHGLPVNRYMLGSNPNGLANGRVMLAEIGSMTLEFTKLSMLTGDDIYYQAAQRAVDTLDTAFEPGPLEPPADTMALRHRLGSLLPTYVDPDRPEQTQGEYTLGGLADSYYEYLIKQAQLTSNVSPQYARMYEQVAESVLNYLASDIKVVPGRRDLVNLGMRQWGHYSHTWEHLTCFAGGMLGLGARVLGRHGDLEVARNFTETCAWAYESTATGLGPETLVFYDPDEEARFETIDSGDGSQKVPRGNPVIGVKHSNPRFIGRPETIESIFYMWRLTGDRKWQDYGWRMFVSWMEHSITEHGFASLSSVHMKIPNKIDSMESFVMAETLKYYYLLFSPKDFFSLDDWVFNTEAHPLRIPKAEERDFTPLWAGPERDEAGSVPMSSFVSTGGQGTYVQQWARVQQAAGLLHPDWRHVQNDVRPPPPKFRKPIKASEEDLAAARKKQAESLEKLQGGSGPQEDDRPENDDVDKMVPLPADWRPGQDDAGHEPIKKVAKRPPVAFGGGRGMGGFGLAMEKPMHGK